MDRDSIAGRGRSSSLGRGRALVIVLAASVFAGWMVFALLVRQDRPPQWDEAAHALQGALVARDLLELDLLGLLFDTYRQVWWPPLHSLAVGSAFVLAGTSMATARAVSVIAFALLAPILFLIGRLVAPRHGTLAGGVAAALALSSPALIVPAAEVMLEALGALAIGLTMLTYVWIERGPAGSARGHALLGVTVVLTYLVKTNYGVLVLLAVLLTKVLEAEFRPRRLLTRANLWAALPVAVFAVAWFAYPAKAVSTWNALVNVPSGGEAVSGLQGFLFYPLAFADLSGSWWMALLLCTGLVTAWTLRREPGIAFLAVLALIQFTIGELHHTKAARHVLPMFPPMFVLTGVAATGLWSRAAASGRGVRFAMPALLLGVAGLHLATIARRDWSSEESRDGTGVRSYVSSLARTHAPALVLGTRETYPGPPGLDWDLVAGERLFPVTAAGSAMDPRQDRALARLVAASPLPEGLRSRASRVLDRYDASPASRSLYVGDRIPEAAEQFARVLERTLEYAPTCAIVALVSTADTTRYRTAYFAPPIVAAGFVETSVRQFPEAATRVHVYRDVTGSACREDARGHVRERASPRSGG